MVESICPINLNASATIFDHSFNRFSQERLLDVTQTELKEQRRHIHVFESSESGLQSLMSLQSPSTRGAVSRLSKMSI
jgi:hypothetical protein